MSTTSSSIRHDIRDRLPEMVRAVGSTAIITLGFFFVVRAFGAMSDPGVDVTEIKPQSQTQLDYLQTRGWYCFRHFGEYTCYRPPIK